MHITLFALLIILSTTSASQSGRFPLGARNSALGGATVSVSDSWSLFNNIAGIGSLNDDAVLFSYQNRFGLKELQTIGAGFIRDLGSASIGLGTYRFGDDLFSEQKINLGIAHRLDNFSLGINFNYLQYNISKVGTKGALSIEMGGIAFLSDKVSIGANVFNINQTYLNKENRERIPVVMKAGIAFRPNEDLLLALETEKEIDFKDVIRIGVEYNLIKNIAVRTGLSTDPFIGNFGFGFNPTAFQFDYAFSNRAVLGSIHEVSLSYQISR